MSCCNFLKIFVPALIGSVFAGQCGTVDPRQQTVAEGTTVQFRLTNVKQSVVITWRYDNNTLNSSVLLCESNTKHCVKSNKYSLLENGYQLSITALTHSDAGYYFCFCYNNKGYREWSSRGALSVKRESTDVSRSISQTATATVESETKKITVSAKPSASNEQEWHQKIISTESTTEYHLLTNSATTKVESETTTTQVSDSVKDCKVPSTPEDTSQVMFAGGVAVGVGVMLTVIVVVAVCKKRKKDGIHRSYQKSGPTQSNSKGGDGQGNSLVNDSNHLHRGDPSEQEAPVVLNKQENNSDGQQASGSAPEQTFSKYETIIPVTDRAVSTQEREMYKIIKVEDEGTPEYETVA